MKFLTSKFMFIIEVVVAIVLSQTAAAYIDTHTNLTTVQTLLIVTAYIIAMFSGGAAIANVWLNKKFKSF